MISFCFFEFEKENTRQRKEKLIAESFIQLISAALKTVARFKKGEKNRKAEIQKNRKTQEI